MSSRGGAMPGGTLLAGKHVVVTGATSGIGRAVALAFAAQGARLFCIGRDAARTSGLQQELGATGSAHVALEGDVASPAFLAEAAAKVRSFCGGSLDVLVHSAGVYAAATVADTSAEEFDAAVDINLRAPFLLTGSLLPALRAARGMVVLMNSSIVSGARAGTAAYAASKAGLRAFADTLRTEVNEDGVRVLTVILGRTATPMQEHRYHGEGIPYDPARLLQPEAVASAVIDAFTLRGEVTEIALRPMSKS